LLIFAVAVVFVVVKEVGGVSGDTGGSMVISASPLASLLGSLELGVLSHRRRSLDVSPLVVFVRS
jgi:hypothetical protein